uniref:LAGLIDADG_2 domain-containing protein n=1 Tax=Strongyloides papillosus TaxID=174720 RepID=A0A0N5B895_STREA
MVNDISPDCTVSPVYSSGHIILFQGNSKKIGHGTYHEFHSLEAVFEKFMEDYRNYGDLPPPKRGRNYVDVNVRNILKYVGKMHNTCLMTYSESQSKYKTMDKKWILCKFYIYLRNYITNQDKEKIEERFKNLKPVINFD